MTADQLQLLLGSRFGQEVVHAGLLGDLCRGEAIVAGHHHRRDPHPAQLLEAGAHPLLDDVLQVDDSEDVVVATDRQRRASLAADPVELRL